VKKSTNRTEKNYEEIGRMIESLYETGQANRRAIYRISFVKGMVSGFGGVLGATILIGLLVWTLTFFKQVPLLGPLANRIQRTVQHKEVPTQ